MKFKQTITNPSIAIWAFVLSFLIVLGKGIYRNVDYKYMKLNFFESELLNKILPIGGTPLVNLFLLYGAFFAVVLLTNKALNTEKDKALKVRLLNRLMMPSVFALILHPFFYFVGKISWARVVLPIIDNGLILGVIIYAMIWINKIYNISILKTVMVFIFLFLPSILIFSGKAICPYFLWIR